MRSVQLISSTLRVEQGSLTGESEAVNKTNKAVSEDADITGKRCMMFAGTTVVNGNCICSIEEESEEDTPLKKKLNEFGELLTLIIGVMCGSSMSSTSSVSAWNTQDGSEECPCEETTKCCCTSVICSDKTGSLTTNQMAVSKLVAMASRAHTARSFKVDGTTYNPFDGEIHDLPTAGLMDLNLQMIAKIAAVCNDAGITQSEHKYVAHGMPTEAALKVLAEKMSSRYCFRK